MDKTQMLHLHFIPFVKKIRIMRKPTSGNVNIE